MARNLLFSICLFLLPLSALAEGFVGLPITNLNDWAVHTNNYLEMLHGALDERTDMLGQSPVEIVNNWTVFDGYSTNNTFWTNVVGGVTNTGTYTNIVIETKTVTTTNQFTNFSYTLTGGGTMTGVPFMTRTALAEIDSGIERIVDDFLSYNAATNAALWHKRSYVGDYVYYIPNIFYTNENVTIYPITSIPAETMENLFYHAGIGHVEDAITNQFGIVTNGTAYWTRQPPYTNRWVLAEAHYTSAWDFVEISQFSKRLYETNYPALKYLLGGTNAFTGSVDVTVSGTYLDLSDQSTPAGSEVVTLTTTNWTPCTNHWYNISSISPDDSFNTGDVVSLVYTGKFTLYGDSPYVMNASDFNERYEAVRRFLFVKNEGDYVGPGTDNVGYEGGGRDDVYATAISDSQADWQAVTNDFSSSKIEAIYGWSPTFRGDYIAEAYRWSPTSEIHTVDMIYTNLPYTWEYFGWSLERSYGLTLNHLVSNTNSTHYTWEDFDDFTLSPDVADGNKFSYYAFDTNVNTSTQVVWNSYVAALAANISVDPVVPPYPTPITTFQNDIYEYLFNIFPSTDIGSINADASGWFYLKYDFEYE